MKLLLGLAAFLATASAALAQSDVCIPVATTTPTLDGTVDGDPGWQGAARIDLDCPGVAPSTYIRLCRGTAPNTIYVGVQVNTPGIAPNSLDRVVLGFVPDNVDSHAWRIHVTPFSGAIFEGASTAASVSYWTNYSSWNSGSSGKTPGGAGSPSSWLQPANIKVNNVDNSRWGLEMMIPISDAAAAGAESGVYLPPTGTFKVYFNVVKTVSGSFVQYPWPSSSYLGTSLCTGTPLKTSWGTGSLVARVNCNVLLTWDKIGIFAPPADTDHSVRCLSPDGGFSDCSGLADTAFWPDLAGPPTTFYAKPRNRMATIANVGVRFKTAPWGSPGPDDWTLVQYPDGIAPLVNPTDASASLQPGSQANLSLDWCLTYKQSCQTHVDPYKSILVEMLTSDPEHTTFSAPSVQRCMDTVSLSSVSRAARIGTKGFPAPASGNDRMILSVGKDIRPRPSPLQPVPAAAPARPRARAVDTAPAAARIPARLPDDELYPSPEQVAADRFSSAVPEFMIWTCRCFRKTGTTFAIDDVQPRVALDNALPAGGFGYIAGHRGEVESWRSDFSGQGLKKIHEGLFEMDIPHGSSGLVLTFLEAEEFRRWGADVKVGYAGPLGPFGKAVNGGWSETISLEYRLDRTVALGAQFGMEEFRRGQGGSDVTMFQNSAQVKVSFLEGDLRPYAEAGVGFYVSSPGRDAFGLNLGVGARYRISDLVGLEAGAQYHEVLTPGPNARFATLQAGVSLRF